MEKRLLNYERALGRRYTLEEFSSFFHLPEGVPPQSLESSSGKVEFDKETTETSSKYEPEGEEKHRLGI